MTRPARREKGLILLQTIVLIALLALVAAMSLEVVLGRYVIDARSVASNADDQAFFSAQSLALDCFNGSGLGSASCNVPAPVATCLGQAQSTFCASTKKVLTVTVSGSPPACQVTFNISDGACPP